MQPKGCISSSVITFGVASGPGSSRVRHLGPVEPIKLSYFLAHTTVSISGIVTYHHDEKGRADTFDRTSCVSIGVGADTRRPHEVVLRRKRLFRGDSELDLQVAPDGRLVGAGFQTNGGGADAAGGVVALLSLSATMATAGGTLLALQVAESEAGDADTDPDMDKEPDQSPQRHPDGEWTHWDNLKKRSQCANQAVWDLQERALKLAAGAAQAQTAVGPPAVPVPPAAVPVPPPAVPVPPAGGPSPPAPTPAGPADQLKAVSTALDLARAEAAAADLALRSWQDKHYPDTSTTYTYVFGIEEIASLTTPAHIIHRALPDLGDECRVAARALHTIVFRVGDGPRAGADAEVVEIGTNQIGYRSPYPATLAIYELDEPGGLFAQEANRKQLRWRLRQLVPFLAIGPQSEVRKLSLTNRLFGKSSFQVDFGDSGSVSHVSVADVGPVANVSNTLSGAVQSAAGSGAGGSSNSGGPPSPGGPPAPGGSPGLAVGQDPLLLPLQMEAAVKKLRADIAGYDKTIRDAQQGAPAASTKDGGGKTS